MEETLISTFAMFLVLYIAFRLLPTELFGLCENDIWQIVDYVNLIIGIIMCNVLDISCEF